jgi:hypothetical protein
MPVADAAAIAHAVYSSSSDLLSPASRALMMPPPPNGTKHAFYTLYAAAHGPNYLEPVIADPHYVLSSIAGNGLVVTTSSIEDQPSVY